MKRNSKYVLVVLSVLILLLVLPSCNKKSSGSENTSVVSQLISKESNSETTPIVVVQDPQTKEEKKEEPAPAESAVAAPSSEPVAVASVVVEEAPADEGFEYKTTFSYMGLKSDVEYNETAISIVLPYGTTQEDVDDFIAYIEGEYPLIEKAEYSAESRTLVFTYPLQKKADAEGLYSLFEASVKSYIDSVFALEVEEVSSKTYSVKFTVLGDLDAVFTLDSSSLTISLSRALDESEFNEVAEAVVEALPELASSYADISDDGLVCSVEFDEKSASDLEGMYERIMNLLSLYGENVEVVSDSVEEPAADVPAPVEEEKKEEVEETVAEIVDSAEEETQTVTAVKTPDYSSFGVSVSGSLYYDIPHNILRGTVGGGVEYSFMPDFSFGIKSEYDFGGYVNLLGYMKWNFYDSLYAYIGGGYRFGFGETKDYSSFLLEGGLGYAYNFGLGILGYAELGASYAPMSYTKIAPVMNLGIRFTF